MKVLAIDPGLAILGWSLIHLREGGRHDVQFGTIETPAHLPLTKRLTLLYDELTDLCETEKPDHLAIETLFFAKNAKTLAQVGHARGIVLLIAGQFKMDVFEYAPRQIKLALTGYGAADKKQMQERIKLLLGLKEIPKPDDAADAVAVGLCHLQYAQVLGKSAVTV
jgi:crossover junction endodeoxyribonuclease RuvC